MFCVLSAYSFENNSAQFPSAQFTSVNSFQGLTNHQYNITPVGAVSLTETQNNQGYRPSPRKNLQDPNEPYMTPVGDCPIWLLVLFAVGYCYYEKRKTVSV